MVEDQEGRLKEEKGGEGTGKGIHEKAAQQESEGDHDGLGGWLEEPGAIAIH
jgi:hypothetical protein